MSVYEELLEYIQGLWIVDTHEHLPAEADRPKDADVLSEWLQHYFSSDLVSAGLSDAGLVAARDSSQPLAKRWELVETYWNAARHTGYGQALDLAAKGVYGVDGVSGRTIAALNEAFCAARAKGGHYRRVLKDLSRIAVSIVDSRPDCEPEFFVSTTRMGEFFGPGSRAEVQAVADRLGITIHSLDDWIAAMEMELDRAFKKGVVCLKCGLAYQRTLYFEKVTHEAAAEQFNRIFGREYSPGRQTVLRTGKVLQDYIMHRLLAMADARGLTYQFHTGIQEGNGNLISNSNPVLLSNLFLEYRNVKFDIFHMGYPYCMELANLAKNFRNVFIDMCWGHIISPVTARRALAEWLEAVPANKISAFGGDYRPIDCVYGHQVIARRNVAQVLAEKVAAGLFDVDRAKELATWLFVDNPARLFHLEDHLAKHGRPPRRPTGGGRRKAGRGKSMRRKGGRSARR